jgi:hypothetical protein
LSISDDGSFEYIPDFGYYGEDSFVYSVSDGIETAEATATISVLFVTYAPSAHDDAYSV